MIADDSRSVEDRATEMATRSIISKAGPEWDVLLRGEQDEEAPYRRPDAAMPISLHEQKR